jgi:hypothetical protein
MHTFLYKAPGTELPHVEAAIAGARKSGLK